MMADVDIRGGITPLAIIAALLFAACGSGTSSAAPSVSSTAAPSVSTEARASAATAAPGSASPLPTAALTPAPALIDADLSAALAYATADVSSVEFTDWARLFGTRPDPSAESAALVELSKTYAIPASGLPSYAATIRPQWSFGVGDLAWEADFANSGAPLTVLQFRDTFDLASLGPLMEGRAYTKGAAVDGVQPYAHALDPTKPFISQGPQLMTNLGLDIARHRLIVAASPDALTAAVQARAAGPAEASPGARALALAAALGSPYAAILSVEPGACSTFGGGLGLTPPSASATSGVSALGVTAGTALGFSEAAAGGAAVTVALLYTDPAKAAADLAPRSAYAAGAVTQDGQPYASTVLALANGRTAGAVLVFDGTPAGPVSRVLTAFERRDLPFAACP
jgi:hypothetical protein